MKELWCVVENFENYEISSYGRIKNIKTNYYKKATLTNDGYLRTTLSKNQKFKTYYVHRLVGIHFLDNGKKLPFINHKDGDKINNNVYNLEWVTPSDNTKHAYQTGLVNTRKKSKILTDKQIVEIL